MARLENPNGEVSEKNKLEETGSENASPIVPIFEKIIGEKMQLTPGMTAAVLRAIGESVENNGEPDEIMRAFSQLTEADISLYTECTKEMGFGWRAAAQAASKAEQAGLNSSQLRRYARTLQDAAYPNGLAENNT